MLILGYFLPDTCKKVNTCIVSKYIGLRRFYAYFGPQLFCQRDPTFPFKTVSLSRKSFLEFVLKCLD